MPPGNPSQLWVATFLALTDLLRDYVLPPQVAAKLLRALPYIPGVMVEQAPGRVGFAWGEKSGRPSYTETIILDPSTYVVTGIGAKDEWGKTVGVMEIPARIPVSGPGVRP